MTARHLICGLDRYGSFAKQGHFNLMDPNGHEPNGLLWGPMVVHDTFGPKVRPKASLRTFEPDKKVTTKDDTAKKDSKIQTSPFMLC